MPENYHVAMKAFIRRADDLLICKDRFSDWWDLPGGRIGEGELESPLDKILEREIREELGPDVKYKNKGPIVIFRHRRTEQIAPGKPEINILMIGFDIEYLGGEIKISEEHTDYKWLPVIELENEIGKYFSGGFLDGIKKFIDYLRQSKKQIIY